MSYNKHYTDLFIDFDDTLYDTHGNAIEALAELYEQLQLSDYFDDPELFYSAYWKTNVELWSLYSRGEITRDYLIVERFRRPLSLGRGLCPTREYCLGVSDRFLDLCSVKPGVVPGAHRLMEHLRRRGYRLHLCSNGFHEVQYRKLRASAMYDYFDNIILSEDAGANKPSRQFFEYAFSQTQAQRETTLMIGDNFATDIEGAMAAGLDTLFFNRDPQFVPEPKPTFEVRGLEEIMAML